MEKSQADIDILAELNYAKNRRLDALMQKGIEELRQLERTERRANSATDVDPAFAAWNLSQAQRIVVNPKEEKLFLTGNECLIEKVYLRDRLLKIGERILVVTDSAGEVPAYVLEINPAGKSYRINATSLQIKKCEP